MTSNGSSKTLRRGQRADGSSGMTRLLLRHDQGLEPATVA